MYFASNPFPYSLVLTFIISYLEYLPPWPACLWSLQAPSELSASKADSFSCLKIFSGYNNKSQPAWPNKVFHLLVLTKPSSFKPESTERIEQMVGGERMGQTGDGVRGLGCWGQVGSLRPKLPSQPRICEVLPRISMGLYLLHISTDNPITWLNAMSFTSLQSAESE